IHRRPLPRQAAPAADAGTRPRPGTPSCSRCNFPAAPLPPTPPAGEPSHGDTSSPIPPKIPPVPGHDLFITLSYYFMQKPLLLEKCLLGFTPMQLKALKVFCDVVRFRSFSQAASANERSQSAVSQIVLALEKDLGTQLIDRSSRPLQLTELGKAVYERCQRIVDQWEELHDAVRTAQANQIVNVRVAAIYSV